MPTLVLDPAPAEIDALIERRRRLGLDHRDEIWEGTYRMNPPPSHEHQVILQQLAELLGPLARRAGSEPLIQEFGLGDVRELPRARRRLAPPRRKRCLAPHRRACHRDRLSG